MDANDNKNLSKYITFLFLTKFCSSINANYLKASWWWNNCEKIMAITTN